MLTTQYPPTGIFQTGYKVVATILDTDGRQGVSTVRTFVVDDYEPFLRYLRSILGRRPGLQVIGEASDGLEAVQKAQDLKPDLILLDIRLPTLNGIEVSQRISRVAPHAKIVFVTQEADPDVVRAVLDHSPRGYVLKLDANSELLHAVDAVLEGKQFVSKGVKARR